MTEPSVARQPDHQKPHLQVRVRPLDSTSNGRFQVPTASARADDTSSLNYIQVSSGAEDTVLLYENFPSREVDATGHAGRLYLTDNVCSESL